MFGLAFADVELFTKTEYHTLGKDLKDTEIINEILLYKCNVYHTFMLQYSYSILP